ncbi:MAG: hydantoinase/oxoprolinase family protein [Dehalococcoidia bacterium]
MPEPMVGIDVGGTFTDFILLSQGGPRVHKVPSTPQDPAQAFLQGLRELKVPQGTQLIHGSTVATNALLEGKGARTALITTAGFEDIIEIGRQNRPALYDLLVERPPPLVPPERRLGVRERMGHTGTVLTPLVAKEVERVVQAVQRDGVKAVALSLLFSFLNPAHEEVLAQALERLSPQPFLSVSSQVLPEFREYERTNTVVVNAYVGPVMSHYLEALNQALGSTLRIMQSSGGSITAGLATRQPVRTILSGPAGGVVGAFHVASQAGYPEVITLDMGGTSTDVSLCPGRIQETTAATLGGYPLSVPMIEIHTVGAGGGSIARLDPGGALLVGPQSAGADPGPACYGRGQEITVTDANLLLGRLQPEHFLGGRMALDVPRASGLMEGLARQMNTDAQRAALGIVRVVNANMERAIRAISLERGYDQRRFTLLAFGGAGPMHACELAAELGIPRVLVPPHPGILSALGVAIADIVKDYSRTVMLHDAQISREALEELFGALEQEARQEMQEEGIPRGNLVARRALDVRYVGQAYELTVDYPRRPGELGRAIASAFHRAHRKRFGYADPSEPIEVVNLRLKVVSPIEKPSPTPQEPAGENSREAQLGKAPVVFRNGPASTPLYLRERLRCGNRIPGPALVLQMDSTTVIPPRWAAQVDGYGNLVVTPERGA